MTGIYLTNIDEKTGIRYGVISMHYVSQAWAEESEPDCDDSGTDFSQFFFDKDGYEATQSADDSDIFITKSPYYTFTGLCSPCAPGAGDLRSIKTRETGVKTYCFAPDWFAWADIEGEHVTGKYRHKDHHGNNAITLTTCKYAVYRVDNDECVFEPHICEQ